jgi:hypothetical protein
MEKNQREEKCEMWRRKKEEGGRGVLTEEEEMC